MPCILGVAQVAGDRLPAVPCHFTCRWRACVTHWLGGWVAPVLVRMLWRREKFVASAWNFVLVQSIAKAYLGSD